ncbi:MAG TPA: diadenylate cyclase CdaA, partial [Methylomirabilota bacterium]|nr:diadenylate cyclase CdaA [Methylomirabilota bacterium]
MIDGIREFIDTYFRGSWTSIIDIGLVAFVIYWLFILIRGTRAVRIVIGMSILYLVYLAAILFGFDLLRRLLEAAAVVGLFAVVVVFQPELRRALEQIGRIGSFNRFFVSSEVAGAERVAREISRAARILAGSRHGALIALERETGLQDLATESGVPIHADLRAELLVTIFYRGTALHDGAVIISGDRITSAGVLLPMSQTVLDSERYGTRHRAAIGISEQTDAVVIVVSEETGSISLVIRGRIERNLTEQQLRR